MLAKNYTKINRLIASIWTINRFETINRLKRLIEANPTGCIVPVPHPELELSEINRVPVPVKINFNLEVNIT